MTKHDWDDCDDGSRCEGNHDDAGRDCDIIEKGIAYLVGVVEHVQRVDRRGVHEMATVLLWYVWTLLGVQSVPWSPRGPEPLQHLPHGCFPASPTVARLRE